jgi:hypothetical protein
MTAGILSRLGSDIGPVLWPRIVLSALCGRMRLNGYGKAPEPSLALSPAGGRSFRMPTAVDAVTVTITGSDMPAIGRACCVRASGWHHQRPAALPDDHRSGQRGDRRRFPARGVTCRQPGRHARGQSDSRHVVILCHAERWPNDYSTQHHRPACWNSSRHPASGRRSQRATVGAPRGQSPRGRGYAGRVNR